MTQELLVFLTPSVHRPTACTGADRGTCLYMHFMFIFFFIYVK